VVLGFYGDFYTGVAGRNPGLKAIPYFVSAAGLRQANANLVYASFELNHRGIRIYLAPAAGSYMKANYAAEPSWIRNVLEARAGFCLNRKRSIWLDAGLMSAPFTMEQAVNRDLLTYSRSLAAEYSPYYVLGGRLSFPVNYKIQASVFLIQGWQQARDVNKGKALASQWVFHHQEHQMMLSTYTGDERSISHPEFRMRYFLDGSWNYQLAHNWQMAIGTHVGYQRYAGIAKMGNTWWQANVQAQKKMDKGWRASGRIEYFHDPHQVLITTSLPARGFRGGSSTLGLSKTIGKHLQFRSEVRWFRGGKNVFPNQRDHYSSLWWLLGGLNMWL